MPATPMPTATQIFTEMLIHPAVCVHPAPAAILAIGADEAAVNGECAKYRPPFAATYSADRSVLAHAADASADIIVLADKAALDLPTVAHLQRVLTDRGIAVVASGDCAGGIERLAADLAAAGSFRIAMPYRYDNAENGGMIFLSKLYHPLADINLQRADMTDGYACYNTELHSAAFALPTAARARLAGIAKN